MGFCGSRVEVEGVGSFLGFQHLFHAQALRQLLEVFFSGRIVLRRGNQEPFVSLHQISAPAVLGLAGTMLAQPSTVTISALKAAETAFISRAQFLQLLAQFPQAGLAFSQLIATELAHTYSHLSQLRGSPRMGSASAPAR